jgi:MYXO-CTERM domain-containing protein
VNVLAGELSLQDAFVVQPADTRPRLLAIEPASVEQGDTTTVRVRFGGTMAGTPTVNLGEGIVAEVRAVEGDEVVIDLTVAASAPLGGHLLSLDDGTRIFEGVELEVEDWRPPVVAACATGGGAPRWVALALGLAWLRRRRDARR